MDARELEARVRAELATLGDTAEEMAEKLHALGVRGTIGCAEYCPLARHFTTVLGMPVAVTEDSLTAWPGGDNAPSVEMEWGGVPYMLVTLFDANKLPQLVDPDRPRLELPSDEPAAGGGA